MKGADPVMNTKNTRREMRENTWKTQEDTQTNQNDHISARSSKHDRRYNIQSQQRMVHSSRFFSKGGLDGGHPKGGLESKGIFSIEGPLSLLWSRFDVDVRSSISNMSYHNANPRKEVEVVYL